MFAKLLKHEWRASSRLLTVLTLAALGVGVLLTAIFRVLSNYGDVLWDAEGFWPLTMIAMIFLAFALYIGLVCYPFATQLLLLYRFYKSRFTDQGYLTFTLPVSSRQILLSSWLHMLIWQLISGAVLMVAVFLIVLIGASTEGLIDSDMLYALLSLPKGFSEMFQTLASEPGAIVFLVLLFLLVLVTVLCTPIQYMVCVVAGCTFAKKHKLLASFGIYYLLSMVIGLVSYVLMIVTVVLTVMVSDNSVFAFYSLFLGQLILPAALGIGGYFLSVHLMTKKLNLP